MKNFIIGTLSPLEASFTVQPEADLTAGKYKETITSAEVEVRFTVNEEFKASINPDKPTIIEGES